MFCSRCVKNAIGNVTETALNLQVALVILTILIPPIQEHGICFHLFVLSSISFINILQILGYRSFASLGFFFFSDVMINGIFSLISLSAILLLVYRTSNGFLCMEQLNFKTKQNKTGSSHCGSAVTKTTSIHGDAGSVLGLLRTQNCHELVQVKGRAWIWRCYGHGIGRQLRFNP